MKEKELFDIVSRLFMFKNVSLDRLKVLMDEISPEIKHFTQGECIYSPKEFSTKIGFVIKGRCTVERQRADGVPIPLNLLSDGDAFGVLSVFSDGGDFPTFIRAKKETQVVFFERKDVINLVKSEPEIAINTIYFLGNRIAFLNDKLSTFSSDNTEQKVAKLIMQEYRKHNTVSFPFNCKRASEALNIGRASLYRAIDALTRDGILTLENKKINISDFEGLERITK